MTLLSTLELKSEINHITPLDTSYSFALSTTNGVKLISVTPHFNLVLQDFKYKNESNVYSTLCLKGNKQFKD